MFVIDELVDEIFDDLEEDINIVSNYRYTFRSWYEKIQIEETLANLDDNRFKMLVRMTRVQFNLILDLIKDHIAFHGENSNLQFSPFFQLTLVLFLLGSNGDNASRGKNCYFIRVWWWRYATKSDKTIFSKYIGNREDFLKWPSEKERKALTSDTFEELPRQTSKEPKQISDGRTMDRCGCGLPINNKHINSISLNIQIIFNRKKTEFKNTLVNIAYVLNIVLGF